MESLGERRGLVKVGHAELAVDDLGAAREFYVDLLGFVETERAGDRLYLRGNADTDHHCLVLTEGPAPRLLHYAWRVASDDDLELLERRFAAEGGAVRRVESGEEAGQGKAIAGVDACGHPVEFYHEMVKVESLARQSHRWRGAAIQRLDHVALMTPDVAAGVRHFERMGLHLSECVESQDGSGYFAAFLHRTSHSHDVALVHAPAPAMQHLSFWVENAAAVIHTADVLADAGRGEAIEFGPGRHKTTNSFFVYLKDPAGNRIEVYSEGYWAPDFDDPPIRWTFDAFLKEGRVSFGGQAPPSFTEGIPVGPGSE
jgi:catechol 2,3-dioxygenase